MMTEFWSCICEIWRQSSCKHYDKEFIYPFTQQTQQAQQCNYEW